MDHVLQLVIIAKFIPLVQFLFRNVLFLFILGIVVLYEKHSLINVKLHLIEGNKII